MKTKKEVEELGFKTLIDLNCQKKIKKLKGKLKLDGDLEAMRTN